MNMKKIMILAVAALATFVGCNKIETPSNDAKKVELSFVPMTGSVATRGYTTGTKFADEYLILNGPINIKCLRDMQISAYLYPQNGEPENYFVNKTFKHGDDNLWHNYVGTTLAPIYKPLGGKLEFLAYSLTSDAVNVDAAWDEDNAASKVVLSVPAENTQNDILFSSAYSSDGAGSPVEMTFKHAQAWLTFNLRGNREPNFHKPVVKDVRIELEDVYNAGTLTVSSNDGDALAEWDFSAVTRKNIDVDNIYEIQSLDDTKPGTFHMLIPQQKKTSFVIYYTLLNGEQFSYRFTTDKKTWLMGEHYVYDIFITANEVTVAPSVTLWNDVVPQSYSLD